MEGDAVLNTTDYLSFDVDEDVTVYIAYEKKDNLLTSTIPAWLQTFEKDETNEIAAQYYYYDVYHKNFPKGTITLPAADVTNRNITKNYIVFVKKMNFDGKMPPIINEKKLPQAYVNYLYSENLSCLQSNGDVKWYMNSGLLPPGLTLNSKGLINGYPTQKGQFDFSVSAKDALNDPTFVNLSIIVDSVSFSPIKLTVKDTSIIKNSGSVTYNFNSITNNISQTQNISFLVYADNDTVVTFEQPVKMNESTYTFEFNTITNKIGTTKLSFVLIDNNNPDTLNNRTYSSINVIVIPYINNPPTCDAITDINVVKGSQPLTFYFTGVTDGNDNSQNITATVSSTPFTSTTRQLKINYIPGSSGGSISFIPALSGTAIINLVLKDNGGTFLGGLDTKIVNINVTVTNATNVLEMDDNRIFLYPNPAQNVLTINNENFMFKNIEIKTINGITVINKELNLTNDNIDIKDLNTGMYIVFLKGDITKAIKISVIK